MKKYDYSPKLYGNIYEYLHDVVCRYANRNAYRWKEQDTYKTKTYEDLMGDVQAFSLQLERRELIGQHIALIGEASYVWVIGFLAILYTGSVVVPLNYVMPSQDVKEDLLFSDAKAVLIGDVDIQLKKDITEFSDIACIQLDDMMTAVTEKETKNYASVCADSLACIIFTTGTTGKRKGVMLSQQNLMAGATQAAAVTDIRQYKRALATLPNYHVLELSATYLSSLYAGVELYLGKDVKYFAKNLKREKPEIIQVVPMFLQIMEKQIKVGIKSVGAKRFNFAVNVCKIASYFRVDIYKKLLGSIYAKLGGELKTFVVGGAFLSSETVCFFQKIGIKVLQGYGMTETVGAVSCNREYEINAKSVGTPMPFSELRIRNGEVQVRGKNVMLGYYKEPGLTREAFDEGWLRTGDLGYIDDNGFLYLTGRKKNLIILSDGENINPEMFEKEIQEMCIDISEIIVFQQDNKIMATIYSESGSRENIHDMIEIFNRTVPCSQRVQSVIFSDVPLPRTENGKLKRDCFGKG